MAAPLRPTADFARANLKLTTLAVRERFGRIYFKRHANPLGFGKTPSRFSDPRRRKPENRFGVLYLGETLTVCFLEAVLRDKRNGVVGDYPLDETELSARCFAVVEAATPLSVVDLRSKGAVRMGVPSAHASSQRLARFWSLAFHQRPSMPDEFLFIKTQWANKLGHLRSCDSQASRRRDNAADRRPGLARTARRTAGSHSSLI